jgi:hypothetical protein
MGTQDDKRAKIIADQAAREAADRAAGKTTGFTSGRGGRGGRGGPKKGPGRPKTERPEEN